MDHEKEQLLSHWSNYTKHKSPPGLEDQKHKYLPEIENGLTVINI